MKGSTLNASSIQVMAWYDIPVSGTIALSGTTATFTSSEPLQMHTLYRVVIAESVADMAGNSLGYAAESYFQTTGEPSHLFEPVKAFDVGSWPEAVAIGDMNNDGRNDVVLLTGFSFDPGNDFRVFVFLQSETGELEASGSYPTSGTNLYRPSSLALGDVNHDGRTDVITGISGSGIEVFLQNTSGRLDASVRYDSHNADKVRVADLNDDGLLDIAGMGTFYPTDKMLDVFLQNADGSLPKHPVTYTVADGFFNDMNTGDVNSDGLTDIVLAGRPWETSTDIAVMAQRSDRTLAPPAFLEGGDWRDPSCVAVGDANGDGLADVVVTNAVNEPDAAVGIFYQDQAGGLSAARTHATYDIPEPVVVADVNGDGRNDIIVAHGGWMALGVLLQKPDGTLQEERYPLPYASRYNSQGLAAGDINGDGTIDIVLADYNHGLLVLHHK